MNRIVAILFIFFFGTGELLSQSNTPWLGAGKEVDPYHYTQVKHGFFQNAAISCAHPLASLIGAQILKRGGNAFDAGIAVQLALAVVYPSAGNIGGGGFLIAKKSNNNFLAIDYREVAPGRAYKNMYLDKDGNAQLDLSQNGRLASGVPGTVAGIFATLPSAKLNFKILIQPAIDLAKNGFVITELEAKNLNSYQKAFIKHNSYSPAFVKTEYWKAGDTLFQPELAATLIRIKENGAKGFYEGETAKLIAEEMQRGNGIINTEDLKNYKAKTRTPLSFSYGEYQIHGFPPPSSGGIILLQMMKMVENTKYIKKGFQSPEATQIMIEAERRAYADRAEHLGDPDFWKVPIKELSNEQYISNRMADFTPGIASKSDKVTAGNIKESEETTHISIFDKDGNMVSITTTLNGAYGSKNVVKGAGFLLNNEMDDFSIKAGVANKFGALGGEANSIQPGKRMLSSMCPVIVTKNGKPVIVVGTPGGTTIPTSVFQALINVIEFEMNTDDAINKPKFHHQHFPDEVFIEQDFPEILKASLISMGYKLTNRIPIGKTELIYIHDNKKIEVAADRRGDDSVAGY
jgi:gamma-glutamyltranspeptidase/glutathione hydrolase